MQIETPAPKHVKVERDLHLRLKAQAATEDRTVMAIVHELVTAYLAKQEAERARSA